MPEPAHFDTFAVETRALGKRFQSRWAVAGVDLQVAPGQIFGFLGRNGAGKTTTIRLMLGLLRPTAGAVRIFGHDVATDRLAAARLTGSLLEARATYDNLTGRENLDGTRRLLGLPASEIDRTLEIVDMAGAADRRMGHYSLGMRQRLGLARALLGGPRLLVLDEPMNGLDPDGIRDMRAVIRQLPERSGVTIFLSSHLLSEVQQTATHIGLMHDGRLVLQGPISDLLARAVPELFLRASDLGKAQAILAAEGLGPRPEGEGLAIRLAGGDAAAAAINRRLVTAGVDVHELTVRQGTLESLYLQVQNSQAEAA
jgi:ABC-type multidrug transport system ATPase subunit